jgi:hypothetical protein
MKKMHIVLLSAFLLLAGCASVDTAFNGPKIHATPANYHGDSGMTKRLHVELHGGLFDETKDSVMEIKISPAHVYSLTFLPFMENDKLQYVFEVTIADPRTDYDRAAREITHLIQSNIPEEYWGELDLAYSYDVEHGQ